jgi:hypothetical protein
MFDNVMYLLILQLCPPIQSGQLAPLNLHYPTLTTPTRAIMNL